MQNRKFNNPKKECKTFKNIEKKLVGSQARPIRRTLKQTPQTIPNQTLYLIEII